MPRTRTRTAAVLLAAMLVASVVLPAAAVAEEAVTVSVDQDGETGEAILTVLDNGTAIENATVTVNATGNYSGSGTSATDANGTVRLPAPDDRVDVTISVAANGSTINESTTLVPLDESLAVGVEQSAGEAGVVTVTQYGDPVVNASVSVETVDNVSYAGTGEHWTGENGTVELPAPESTVEVTVTATDENRSAMTNATLRAKELAVSASQRSDGSLSIAVLEGGSPVENGSVLVESDRYTYAGSHDLENGSLTLPAPTQNVTVSVTATVEDRTASTSLNLTVPTDENPNNDFAEALGRFITFLKGQHVDGPLGQEISAFVHANNPASADDDRGPPEHAGNDDDSQGPPVSEDDEAGDDEMTEDGASDRHGPPEHAGPPGEDERSEPDADAAEDEADDGDDADDDADETDDEDDADDTEDADESDDDETEADDDETEADETDDADLEDADAEDDSDDEADAVDDDDAESDDDNRGPPEHAGGPQ